MKSGLKTEKRERRASKVKILLVDDHPENLIALQAVLENPEYDLIQAHSGEEALKTLLHEEIAVILLDVHMPGLDGFETAALIKKRERSKHIPIIFLTAVNKADRYVFKGYAVGAVDYIFKPFEADILRSKVAVFVDLFKKDRELKRSYQQLKAAEEDAQKEKARLNLIIEHVAEPIIVTDSEKVLLKNGRAERFFSASPNARVNYQKAVERNNVLLSSFVTAFVSEASELKREEIELEEPETEEKVPFNITAAKIKKDDEGLFAVVAVFYDLTEIRELERRKIEKELFDMEKMAALGSLAATVAHEINNPLEAILNSIYLISSRTPAQDPNFPFLKIAEKEIERVSRIIKEMLGLYRGGATLPVEVNEVLKETVELLDQDFGRRQIKIILNLQPIPAVVASPDQLKQVFLNMMINARNAMAKGGTLSISTRLIEKKSSEPYVVEIEFKDTGCGIPKEALSRLFEPFYTTQKERKGTGLGLWVSQGIIHNYQGTIQIKSEEGKGTTITILIPVKKVQKEGEG